VFLDRAQGTVNDLPWTAASNSATLSGAGLGFSWAGPGRWSARSWVAVRTGALPALVAHAASGRARLELSRAF
jgi:hypothetical protein